MSPDKGHWRFLGSSLRELYQSKAMFDITIVTANLEIQCHRVVLAAFSPYFRAMFTSGMQENLSNKVRIDTDPLSLAWLIEWFYTGEISINEDNVQQLLESGNFFGVSSICNSCINFLMEEVKDNPALSPSLYELGLTLGIENLLQFSSEVWGKEFHTVCKTEEFFEISVQTLTSFLQRDVICINANGRILLPDQTEDYLLRTILEYIEYHLDLRILHIDELMNLVRLRLCSKDAVELLQKKTVQYQDMTHSSLESFRLNLVINNGFIVGENVNHSLDDDYRKHPVHSYVKTHRYRLSRQDHTVEKFEDLPPRFGYVSGLKIWMHRQRRGNRGVVEIPCGLQVFYNDGSHVHHGGCNPRSMTSYQFQLTPDERITEVYLHTADEYGTFICDLSFRTDLGRTLGPFAQREVSTVDEHRKTYKAGARLGAPASLYLASVRGMVGAFSPEIPAHNSPLTKLGFVFGKFDMSGPGPGDTALKLYDEAGETTDEEAPATDQVTDETSAGSNSNNDVVQNHVICCMCGTQEKPSGTNI